MLRIASLLGCCAAVAAAADMTLVLTKDDLTEVALTPSPASSGGLKMGAADVLTVPEYLGQAAGALYWTTDSFAAGATLTFTCPSTATPAPDTPAPDTQAPDTQAPDTPSPPTPAPRTPAPRTPVPHTAAPRTSAPPTPAPRTSAPPTVAPRTPAPSTPCTAETGWAKGSSSTCFTAISNKIGNNWGWTNVITGSVTLPIYSGAADCDLSKGKHTADAVITYEADGRIRVVVQALAGVSISSYAFWVGNDLLPKNGGGKYLSAPGQLGSSGNDKYFTVDKTRTVYAALHVTTCGTPTATSRRTSVLTSVDTTTCECTFYVVTYHCPPCSTPVAGGWVALMNEDGWETRSCGPTFSKDGGSEQRTVAFRRHVASGTSVTTIASTRETRYLGIFGVPCNAEVEWCDLIHAAVPTGPNSCLATCSEL